MPLRRALRRIAARAQRRVAPLLGRQPLPGDTPPVGTVRFGDLDRLDPVSREWGLERGGPVDRYYITRFLHRHRTDVHGRVLEIVEDVYTNTFGGDRVTQSDILQYRDGEHPRATFTGDIADCSDLPSEAFDCILLTQTLQLVYDLKGAIATVHRILKPGGVALVTVPGITPVNRQDSASWGHAWCWSFTARSMRLLFEEQFASEHVEVETFGNVLTATAFLYGLGQDDLALHQFQHHDPDYEMLIALRAQKAA